MDRRKFVQVSTGASACALLGIPAMGSATGTSQPISKEKNMERPLALGKIQKQLRDDTTKVFKMFAESIESIRKTETAKTSSKAHVTARRLVLHASQAFEAYLLNQPCPYGQNLKYGLRDGKPIAELPSSTEISKYNEEIRPQILGMIETLDDTKLLDEQNPFGTSVYSRTTYVIRHASQHLGHIDQLLYDPSDPRGWGCFSYNYES